MCDTQSRRRVSSMEPGDGWQAAPGDGRLVGVDMADHIRSTRCTVERSDGKFCDVASAPDMPFPICAEHAIQVYVRLKQTVDAISPDLIDNAVLNSRFAQIDERRRREVKADAKRFHVVYYVRVGDLIKIGTTRSLRERVSSYPPGSELLAIEPGGTEVEYLRLKQFRHLLASAKEWFTLGPDLLAHIEDVATQNAELSRRMAPREYVRCAS